MNFKNNIETEELLIEEIETKEQKQKHLILFNDDVNTFDWVIECLVEYCGHNSIQAEQCAYIVHHNGKCSIKRGDLKTLIPICSALLEKGLSAEIN